MIHEIASTWDATFAQTVLIADLYRAMARVERACMGFLGLDNVPELPPPKLSDPFPTAVRWVAEIMPTDQGFPTLTAHQGPIRYHNLTIKIFVACASVANPERGNLQEQYQWVPLAFDKTYAENRTLDGACYRAGLKGPFQWATRQSYAGEWFTGWMLTALVRLRYTVGAS